MTCLQLELFAGQSFNRTVIAHMLGIVIAADGGEFVEVEEICYMFTDIFQVTYGT